jgi:predicted thioesterase
MFMIGQSFRQSMEMGEEHLATELGSGTVRVLGTPAMVALMESTSLRAVASGLEEGMTTVGTAVHINHIRPTPPGGTITCTAALEKIDGRKLVFKVEASDAKGKIGEGTHERVVVDEKKFMAKARGK